MNGWKIKEVIAVGDTKFNVVTNIGREYQVDFINGKFIEPGWGYSSPVISEVIEQAIEMDRMAEMHEYGNEQEYPEDYMTENDHGSNAISIDNMT